MRVALVTGASSGIGRSAALEIARRGNGVILTYDKNKDGGLETVALIEKLGGTAIALPLSIGDTSTFAEFHDAVLDALRTTWQTETLDYLVNNAGFGGGAAFGETTEEFFDDLMRVLLKGPYFLTQKLLPLIADGGAIVNTSSHSALDVGVEAGLLGVRDDEGRRTRPHPLPGEGTRTPRNPGELGSARPHPHEARRRRIREVPRTHRAPRRPYCARPPGRTRRHRQDDRHPALRRQRLGHRPEPRGFRRLQTLDSSSC